MDLSSILRFILISIFFFCSSFVSSQRSIDCNKNAIKRMDELIAKLTTYGNSGRKFPESEEEMPKYCNETKGLLDSIEMLNKNCVKGLSKQILSIGSYTIKTVSRKTCGRTSKRVPENFDAAKCVNKAHKEISKCFSKSIDNMLGMQFAEQNKKIPMACCESHKTKQCISTISEKVDICTEEHTDLTNRFIDSIIGNSINFACAEYSEDSDKCSKLSPPKKRKNQRRTRSIIMAFLQLFESFPETDDKTQT